MTTMVACPPAPPMSMVVATAMAMTITTTSTTPAPAYYPGMINSQCTMTMMGVILALAPAQLTKA